MADSFLKRMESSSHLSGNSALYIELMYERFLDDPNSISGEWREYFSTLPVIEGVGADIAHGPVIGHFERLGRNRLKARPERVSAEVLSEHERKQVHVLELINAFRARGHRRAKLDPLGIWSREDAPDLDLAAHHLSLADFDTLFQTGTSSLFGEEARPLSEIVDALERTYCGSIGAEFMYITTDQERTWVRHRLESVQSKPDFDNEQKRMILDRLSVAEGLEKYLQNRYPGTKRFGLEGGESLIPMLNELIRRCGMFKVIETVIGMAHRGRLNVLVNILGKRPSDLFNEFESNLPVQEEENTGDVKYHQGFSSNVDTPRGGEMHLALSFNPSHLEIVGPVVVGSVRARQDRRKDGYGEQVVPIIIHGDAAIAGQGVVMETFQMSQTRGFSNGGTIHIVINNQIGFTTNNLEDVRSTEYCSEVAKIVRAPIFHVNADDVEAVVHVAQIAADYRSLFGKDVLIDMVSYRRRGHNEAEDPMKTQPRMYQAIRNHPTTRTLYAEQLQREGVVSKEESDQWMLDVRGKLDRGESLALAIVHEPNTSLFVDWSNYIDQDWDSYADYRIDRKHLQEAVAKAIELPTGVKLHKQVDNIYADRRRMNAGALAVNWGFGEIAAYASLLSEGFNVRITGQDVGVGTFSHRHACIYCQNTNAQHIPLRDGFPDQDFSIYDSLLSEEAVLAFEYGYASTSPTTLVVWEAQFGDFANGAQVVIDQFISSGEAKWQRLCGLVMLLPHGFEGAGPEHSSARLERFLQLCADHNMQVCIPSTPAQIFHLLRRQMIRPMRRPLIVLTPKSLLRHKLAVSTLDELANGEFAPIIDDQDNSEVDAIDRVVLCAGKVYYDLLEKRRETEMNNVAIVRIEQLYPFPRELLTDILRRYRNLREVVWCQEEPQNQGAWYSSRHHMDRVLDEVLPGVELIYSGRASRSAPAVGLMSRHVLQQVNLVNDALGRH